MDSVMSNPKPVPARSAARNRVQPANPASAAGSIGERDQECDTGGNLPEISFRNRLLAHIQEVNRQLSHRGLRVSLRQVSGHSYDSGLVSPDCGLLVDVLDDSGSVLQ